MKIKIRTRIKENHKQLMQRFDLQLFKYLLPPLVGTEILEFTGSETGDRVHIRFTAPLNIDWISNITEHGSDDKHSFFVDEGEVLPPGLKKWKHRHLIERISDQESVIVDDIYYEGTSYLMGLLLYPAMYVTFFMRKFQYSKYFRQK